MYVKSKELSHQCFAARGRSSVIVGGVLKRRTRSQETGSVWWKMVCISFLTSHTHTHTLKHDLYLCYPSHKDMPSDFLLPLQFCLLNQPEVIQTRVTEPHNLLILPQEPHRETIHGIVSVKSTPGDARCALAMTTCSGRRNQPLLLWQVSTHSLLLLQPQKRSPLLRAAPLYASSWLPRHFSSRQTI